MQYNNPQFNTMYFGQDNVTKVRVKALVNKCCLFVDYLACGERNSHEGSHTPLVEPMTSNTAAREWLLVGFLDRNYVTESQLRCYVRKKPT